MEVKEYDLVVIGAGPGGYEAALRASQLGLKTAIVERSHLGGTCLNRGCVPTKTLIYASELYRKAKTEFDELGLSAPGLSFEIGKMHQRKEKVLETLRNGIGQLLKSGKVDVFFGEGRVEESGLVSVKPSGNDGEEASKKEREVRLKSRFILLASGARPAKPPIPGVELPGVVTSDEMLARTETVDSKLLIIGGGVIGMEFASIYSALGCQVTVIEMEQRVLPSMDREISQNLTAIMKKRGVQVFTGAKVEEILPGMTEGELLCRFTVKDQPQEAAADRVLVSIGRKANTDGLLAEGVEIKLNRGRIAVDEAYRSSLQGVYAIGDVIGGIQLAHMASAEGIAAVEHMAGVARTIDVKVVPSCIFTDPEIASVGLSVEQAKERGIAVKTCKASMLANGKSIIENQERGFIKVVYNPDSDAILGAQLMCARATDLVAELATAAASGLTRKQLASVIRPHPTFCEGVTAAVRG